MYGASPNPPGAGGYKVEGDWRRVYRPDGREGPTERSVRAEGQPGIRIEEGEGGVSQVNFMHSCRLIKSPTSASQVVDIEVGDTPRCSERLRRDTETLWISSWR